MANGNNGGGGYTSTSTIFDQLFGSLWRNAGKDNEEHHAGNNYGVSYTLGMSWIAGQITS